MTAPSGIFDPASLAELRAFAERAMTATAAIQSRTTTEGVGGDDGDTWTTVEGLDAVPCSFRPAAAPNEVVVADAEQAVATYLVKLPHGTPVTAPQRLVITHERPGIPSPLTLDVVGPYFRSTEISRWVQCTLVGPPATVPEATP